LSTHKSTVTDARRGLRAKRPAGHKSDEIVAMLDAPNRARSLNAINKDLVAVF
jgi:hypothetical protein